MVSVPYGGGITERLVSGGVFLKRSKGIKDRVVLGNDDLINLVNIAVGCYNPVTGFMGKDDCMEVLNSGKLSDGLDWTIPIILRLRSRPKGREILLCDRKNTPVGILKIKSVFSVDKKIFCKQVFGTLDRSHPGVRSALAQSQLCAGGDVIVRRSAVTGLRYFNTPARMRERLMGSGNSTFTAFSTRNVCHIGHSYLHNLALEITDMLGVNVITGPEVEGSFLPDVIFDVYERVIENKYPKERVFLNNLRLPRIYAGPKEAFLQAVILQNYGFTHFIVGRDHAGVGKFYPKYGSQKIFEETRSLDIQILPFAEPRFCKVCGRVTTDRSCRHNGAHISYLNGRDVRRHLIEKNYDRLEAVINKDVLDILKRYPVTHLIKTGGQ